MLCSSTEIQPQLNDTVIWHMVTSYSFKFFVLWFICRYGNITILSGTFITIPESHNHSWLTLRLSTLYITLSFLSLFNRGFFVVKAILSSQISHAYQITQFSQQILAQGSHTQVFRQIKYLDFPQT